MVEYIFTIDYEIYGDGRGSLKELVYEPARRLKELFDKAGAKLVVFVEAAELEKIDRFRTDPAIDDVKQQIRDFHRDGHEIALHIHPQWCNARFHNEHWELDSHRYSLGALSEERIEDIVAGSIDYLREVLEDPDFTPVAFRAGNWLFQPTEKIARVLRRNGIKIDSSVYKGGRQRKHGLDYRSSLGNGYYWNFSDDVNVPDAGGGLLEIPVYTRMVPFWRMITGKRLGLQSKTQSGRKSWGDRIDRSLDLARVRHPLKFDFCRMTRSELEETMIAIEANERRQTKYTPIVAIGHTKDLTDFETVSACLSFIRHRGMGISTLGEAYRALQGGSNTCLSAVTTIN